MQHVPALLSSGRAAAQLGYMLEASQHLKAAVALNEDSGLDVELQEEVRACERGVCAFWNAVVGCEDFALEYSAAAEGSGGTVWDCGIALAWWLTHHSTEAGTFPQSLNFKVELQSGIKRFVDVSLALIPLVYVDPPNAVLNCVRDQ